MKQADKIREFVFREYIEPARRRGDTTVTVRAGDVHTKMGLSEGIPAVCSAMGTNKFQYTYGARLVQREGPTNGCNVFFTFDVRSTPHWQHRT